MAKWFNELLLLIQKDPWVEKFLGFCEPAYIVWVCSLINQGKLSFEPSLLMSNWYLCRVNVPYVLWLSKDKSFWNKGSENLIELSLLWKDQLDRAMIKWEPFLEPIQKVISKFNSAAEALNLYNILSTPLTELFDNISEHANLTEHEKASWSNLYMMQYYEHSKELHFCIQDSGVWIKDSFTKSWKFSSYSSENWYIDLAIQKRMSTKSDNSRGNWLYWCNQIIRRLGWKMFIMSGINNYQLVWQEESFSYNEYRKWIIINMIFNLDVIENESYEIRELMWEIWKEFEDRDTMWDDRYESVFN